MKTWQSFTALKRVKGETESLTAALGKALESVIATPADQSKSLQNLKVPVQAFARVPGILRLLEFPHLALLAQEILGLMADTVRGESELDGTSLDLRLETGFVAVTDLPALLEDAVRRGGDRFAYVFQLVNRLRKARDRAIVFAPDPLSAKAGVDFRQRFITDPETMQGILAKQADFFVRSGKALVKNPDDKRAIEVMTTVLDNLELMLRDYRSGVLWGLARGLVDVYGHAASDREALAACLVELAPSAQKLGSGDEAALQESIDENILEKLVDLVARMPAEAGRPEIIRLWYSLDIAGVKNFRADYRRLQVQYYNKGALSRSLSLINGEIRQLIESINTLAGEPAVSRKKAKEVYRDIFSLVDVLELLQMQYLADMVRDGLPEKPDQDLEQALSRAAGVLFRIHKDLGDKLSAMESAVFHPGITTAGTMNSGQLRILQTAIASLGSVITAVDKYVDLVNDPQQTQDGRQAMEQAHGMLDDVACVLNTIPLEELAQCLAAGREFIAWLLRQSPMPGPDDRVRALSRLLVTSVWHMEQLAMGRAEGGANLGDASEQASQLRDFLRGQAVKEAARARKNFVVISNDQPPAAHAAEADAPTATVMDGEQAGSVDQSGLAETGDTAGETAKDMREVFAGELGAMVDGFCREAAGLPTGDVDATDAAVTEAIADDSLQVAGELDAQAESIGLVLKSCDIPGTETVTTSTLMIPVHTLYGNARVTGLARYAAAVLAVENFLQAHPYRPLDSDMAGPIDLFRKMTSALAGHIRDSRAIGEYAALATEVAALQAAITALETRLTEAADAPQDDAGTGQSSHGQMQRASREPGDGGQVPDGFLTEARELCARLGYDLELLRQSPEADRIRQAIVSSLALLEGAADVAGQPAIQAVAATLGRLPGLAGASSAVVAPIDRGLRYLDNAMKALVAGQAPTRNDDLLAELAQWGDEGNEAETAENPEQAQAEDVPEAACSGAAESPAREEGVDESLLAVFLDEADDILHELDELYLMWRQSPGDQGCVDEYLRGLHTIKGSAALVGETAMSQTAHDFESFILDAGKQGGRFDTEFFRACDNRLHALHDIHRQYERDEDGHIAKRQQAHEASGVAPEPVATVQTVAVETVKPDTPVTLPAPADKGNDGASRQAPDEQVRVSSKLLRTLLNDADEINFSRSRIENAFVEIGDLLVDMDETLNRFKSYANQFAQQAGRRRPAPGVDDGQHDHAQGGFDALELDRYTALQEMSLSLTEDYDDLRDIRLNLASRVKDIDNILSGQQRLTNSLQEGLISSQMVPFASVVPRLRRLVRQISGQLEKQVRFDVSNQQGNLDKNMLQAIITPLEHIIRNAIDHGIESPAARRACGKPEQASLKISLFRRGANIDIEIRDDGQGIDIARVRQQAVKRGLLKAEQEISEAAGYRLLFQPGFSTSATVSSVSGRGVGLDVVKSEIEHIGGSVEVESRVGEGTAFVITLPLTSSLNRALLFEIQDTRYVVLMNTLDGVLVEKLASIHQQKQDTPVFEYGGRIYRYLYLGKLINDGFSPRPDSIDNSIPLLLVSENGRHFALHIDSIIESRDLVVKSFGQQFAAMPGIAGGVILPDGNVAIVLDLKSLVALYGQDTRPAVETPMTLSGKGHAEKQRKLVMVVDDSITVRKITSAILKRNGMDVITARNGLEAVDLLASNLPDLILLDIEMPKMDGFEVASHVRAQDAPVRDIPIIMITSRIGEKHRSRAEEIGVNEYICKPFQEDNLLAYIRNY